VKVIIARILVTDKKETEQVYAVEPQGVADLSGRLKVFASAKLSGKSTSGN
jgi:hypothetical protein